MHASQPLVAPGKPIKLVVWDLDHTLWDGVLVENDSPALIESLLPVILGLDRFGILQSIASRNDFDAAIAHLERLGIREYFLAPQITWSPKSASVSTLGQELNIGLDSVLFIDDQDFELEEVRFAYPEVRTLKATYAAGLLYEASVRPPILTDDAPRRRLRYLEERNRKLSEQEFAGTPEEFLKSLHLELTIRRASDADLGRTEELVFRTNQLNSTGVTYSRAELHAFLRSERHILLVADLKDRFGDYGTIAIALLETASRTWTLKMILVSCRVLSRGIGPNFLSWLAQRASAAGVSLRVEFRDTGRNRPMKVALMMTGFTRKTVDGQTLHLHPDGACTPALPRHLNVCSTW